MSYEEIKKALEGVTPERVERMWWLLHILAKSTGTTNAEDDKWNWINAFCTDYEDDTFNLAAKLGFISVRHDSFMETSTARITKAGMALVAHFDKAPSAALTSTLESLQRENEELRQDRARTARNRDMWKGQVERQDDSLSKFREEEIRLRETLFKCGSFIADRFQEGDPEYQVVLLVNDAICLKPALSAQVQEVAVSPAIKAIAAERARQIEKEGWAPEHDDKYTNGELLEAAACYALHNGGDVDDAPGAWPWSRDFWKPTSRQRDLEKAGALIAAELDRVIRAAAPAKQEG
ncbi:hypothetical protein MRBLRH13_000212 [Agrobacterium radiobacter]|uniref:hypothetical protein n=1 Tax=Agrobacterium radiobacter TaxID=362 RepID=UPI00343BC1F9